MFFQRENPPEGNPLGPVCVFLCFCLMAKKMDEGRGAGLYNHSPVLRICAKSRVSPMCFSRRGGARETVHYGSKKERGVRFATHYNNETTPQFLVKQNKLFHPYGGHRDKEFTFDQAALLHWGVSTSYIVHFCFAPVVYSCNTRDAPG
jgi:hypothetical protein